VVDLLASRGLGYVFGYEVLTREGHTHFVPWVAAEVHDTDLVLTSVFSLLSSSELALYVDNGVRVRHVAREAVVDRYGQFLPPDAEAVPDEAAVSSETRSVQLAANRSIP
jgi:hypothetical protein